MSILSELTCKLKRMASVEISIQNRKILQEAIEVINELSAKLQNINMERSSAYYNGGWIPCDERLPEESYACMVTIIDTEPLNLIDFNNILPYFVGYDGSQWNDIDGEEVPYDVVAWIPAPQIPYKEDDYAERNN